MHTMNLRIEDDFFPHFKAIIDCFVNDGKVIIIKLDDKNLIREEEEEGKTIDSLCRQ